MRIESITYPSPLEESDPENDNIDVHVQLDDGSVYSFLVATPNNIFQCMKKEGIDYFFSYPAPLLVNRLTSASIETALKALLSGEEKFWLRLYGVHQTGINPV
jgi:hypothetical protein